MSVKTVIYIIAGLIILYILFSPNSFAAERIRKAIDWASSGFRATWNPLIGKDDGNS